MNRVLVTGADGFVGTALVQRLRARGVEVVAATRRAKPDCVAVGDLDGATDWSHALQGCEAVIHTAARAHQVFDTSAETLAAFRTINTEATLNLARQALAAGVSRFVFVSSVKVNGEGRDTPYREEDAPAPHDAYALSKLEAEQGLLALCRGSAMEAVIVRPPLVYGPGLKGNLATLVKAVRAGLPLPLGAVRNRRSLIGLTNLAECLILCADRAMTPQAAGEVFFVSDGEDVSTPELLRLVAMAYGVRARLLPVPQGLLRLLARLVGKSEQAERLIGSLCVDDSKARRLIGWRPVLTPQQQWKDIADGSARS